MREGDTLEVVTRLSGMMRAPRLLEAPPPAVYADEEDTLSGQKLS